MCSGWMIWKESEFDFSGAERQENLCKDNEMLTLRT